MEINEVCKDKEEKCLYRQAIEDPNSSFGKNFRESVERYECGREELPDLRKQRCVRECNSSREDAIRLGCYYYISEIKRKRVVRDREKGFVLFEDLIKQR